MTKKLYSIAVVLLISLSLFSQNQFQKINPENVSDSNLEIAKTIAEKLLEGQKSSYIYLLSDNEATPEMVKGLTASMQKSSYENIKDQFGDYESLEYIEAWKFITEEEYIIYRFKGNFSRSKDVPEIRVVMTTSSLISGFWLKPWKDEMQSEF